MRVNSHFFLARRNKLAESKCGMNVCLFIILRGRMIAKLLFFPYCSRMALEIRENTPLAPYTIYKIGGAARFFADVRNADELGEAVRFAADKSAGFFIMGAGSNTLVADEGFEGMVIHMTGGTIRVDGARMIADAGVMMARASAESARAGLAGFAWAIGVPGTIGGSVRGNAGCFGHEMKDVVESVTIFDAAKATSYQLPATSCEFGYRDSIFKRHPEWIVLAATLKLAHGDPALIQEKIKSISAERTARQDVGIKSCGCVFKNPSWSDMEESKDTLTARFPELAEFAARATVPASFLIDRAGLKGSRAGRIVISPKHANFFLNEGGGTAKDVLILVALVKDAVLQKYGITLHKEIQTLGF